MAYYISGVTSTGLTLDDDWMQVYSGGTASRTTVLDNGAAYVSEGGVLIDTIADSCTTNGGVTILSGGKAFDTVLNKGGRGYLLEGAFASGMTVSSEASLSIGGSGASAVTVTQNGGTIQIQSGAAMADATLNDGVVYLFEGGTIRDADLHNRADIWAGALAQNLRVHPGAYLSIRPNGSAVQIRENGGYVEVQDGANVQFTSSLISGLVLSGTSATVHSGTTAVNATVCRDGVLSLCYGGIASGTVVDSCTTAGGLCVTSGGTALETAVNPGGALYVLSGGTAIGANVVADAIFQIYQGASARDLRVQPGATLSIQAGATVTDIVENGGNVYIADGANVTFASNTFQGLVLSSGYAAIHSGTTALNATVCLDGNMNVMDGGMFLSGTVGSCTAAGGLCVSGGGTASGTTVGSGGIIYLIGGNLLGGGILEGGSLRVMTGGKASGVTVDGGAVTVDANGIFSDTVVKSGTVYVLDKGAASGVVLSGSGMLFVCAGAAASDLTVQSGATLYIQSGATVTGLKEGGGQITVEDGASVSFAEQVVSGKVIKDDMIAVHSGTTLTDAVISDNGTLCVSEGGVVSAATVNSCAYTKGLFVFSGGRASATKVNSGGTVYVYEGGIAAGIDLVDGAGCQIREGGSAKDIVVQSGANLTIYAGAKVTNLLENGGIVTIEDGADVTFAEHTVSGTLLNDHTAMVHTGTTMLDTTLEGTGKLVLSNGGLAVSTTINQCDPDGGLCIYSGGTASATTANSGGFVYLFSGGTALDNTITSGGSMTIFSGAVMKNVDIQSGGLLYMSSGSVLTGKIRICPSTLDSEKTYLFIEDNGCTIDFDISEINPSGDAEVLLDDYQRIRSEPSEANYSPDFTITVEPDQSRGTYLLAIARKNPDQLPTLTVKTTDNQTLGTLTNDRSLLVNGVEYRLSIDVVIDKSSMTGTATMLLHIGDDCTGNGPWLPVTTADSTALTNGAVTVTATFDDYSATKQYSFNATNWTDYSEGIVFHENGRVYFRGLNGSGVASGIASYTVRNIDTTAPTDPTGLKATVSGRNVSLSWDISTDNLSGVREYTVRYSHDGQVFTVSTTENSLELDNVDFAVWSWSVQAVDNVGNASAESLGQAFTVSQSGTTVASPTKSDINANGISDVLFQYTGGQGQIGFWLDGTNTWQSTNATHPTDAWTVLGAYDMDANGKADSVLVGDVEVAGVKGMFIGYYADANDLADGSTWVNISYLGTEGTITWKNKVGNLTGNANMNSIVWHSPSAGALGVWTDGTDNWVSLGGGYTAEGGWELVGCGNFTGSGKDSVIMSYLGQVFSTVDIDGVVTDLTTTDAGWTIRGIGDFAGDGKDDIVAFHTGTGLVAMWGDGDAQGKWSLLGQMDANDWFVVGVGDYNADEKDDLLVRQISTGMLGYYTSADMSQWNVLGYGVDMDWTVIA